ncbi:MAG: substrate-binding domain-containing protein [Prevotella sp.]|nr:substrate-binding domain-containing protein [Prevotella sp.]
MPEKIRIKDIAERAGVSVGTVDRVLHNRPNVSTKARQKVEEALRERNYKPNAYASALAYNKSYAFYVLLPQHNQIAYWEEIEEGVHTAGEARKDFNINVTLLYYDRFDDNSFQETAEKCLQAQPDGVVIVPTQQEITRTLTDKLHDADIPFVMLDSYMPDLNPLAFFGQDSFSSGYFAARMLMLLANNESEIMLMKVTKDGKVMSQQQSNREVGFRNYMRDHFPHVKIITLELPFNGNDAAYDHLFDQYFKMYPKTHHCATLGANAHLLGEYILKTNRPNTQIMGYDMVDKNVECLRKGSISFLISQHAYLQGFSCIDTLFKAIVLKSDVQAVNFMPIELLMQENVDFYRRTQL